jgi:hypothetical protein
MAKYVAERCYEAQNDYFALIFLFLFVSRQKENS